MKRKIKILEPSVVKAPVRKRVAAYARVSSGKDAMLQSLSAQVSHYSTMIQNNPMWQYVGVYTDEAMTGTKDGRPEFQRLLANCRAGQVDMVITKSISRFARNTVTLLETVRELKSIGVDVFFEEQNIHSLSGDGELMLTILASFAQEESRSVSENCKWRIRSQFQSGELATLRFLYGYRISKYGIEIDEDQATVVRGIFADYIKGDGCGVIARRLRQQNVPTMFDGQWSAKYVADIIKNEKYTGNALLQKRYVKDHLTKALVSNHGVLPQYFAEGTHEAIIDIETFELAQQRMAVSRKKSATKTSTTNRYPFSSMIRCPRCGKNYKRKLARGQATWNCSTFLRYGKSACFGKRIPEDVLMALTAEVLGLAAFDEAIFKQNITEMVIPAPNKVTFVFTDGHTLDTEWQDRSRSDSWTEEMRLKARDWRLADEHS